MVDYRNRTYAEIAVGETVSITHVASVTDVEALALAAGNVEGFHLEGGKGSHDGLSAQGAAAVALIAGVLSRRLPGPGSRIIGTRFQYAGTINVGDTLDVTVTATTRHDETHTIDFACRCENQRGEVLAAGTANVIAATERIAYNNLATPELILRRNDGFADIFAACEALPAVSCAIVHPCDRDSLLGAVEAARIGLIVPVLVGPAAKIRAVAESEGIDLSAYRLVSTEHSHAAAATAVAMASNGEVEALMKGSLHTDELMSAVVPTEAGLRTARHISHVFILDVPTYPRLLMITDAAINIAPDLADKADICRNAIDLAQRSPSSRRSRRSTPALLPPSMRRRCARWRNAARSSAASSTDRWDSTTRSAPMPRGSSRSNHRSRAVRTSFLFPTSNQATCWPSSCNISPARAAQASCSVPASRLC